MTEEIQKILSAFGQVIEGMERKKGAAEEECVAMVKQLNVKLTAVLGKEGEEGGEEE